MIAIKNMQMPQSCDYCRLTDDRWCYAMDGNDIWRTCGMRPDNCPLTDLPDGLYQVQGEKIWKYHGKGEKQ